MRENTSGCEIHLAEAVQDWEGGVPCVGGEELGGVGVHEEEGGDDGGLRNNYYCSNICQYWVCVVFLVIIVEKNTYCSWNYQNLGKKIFKNLSLH